MKPEIVSIPIFENTIPFVNLSGVEFNPTSYARTKLYIPKLQLDKDVSFRVVEGNGLEAGGCDILLGRHFIEENQLTEKLVQEKQKSRDKDQKVFAVFRKFSAEGKELQRLNNRFFC
jgi:hypothetical protein